MHILVIWKVFHHWIDGSCIQLCCLCRRKTNIFEIVATWPEEKKNSYAIPILFSKGRKQPPECTTVATDQ